ncbi:Histone-like DNA-binding protein [Crocosphaera chwakensis CCY0110]|uniref:Histone-like DNA-binding protein n=2 Tax=Crocosphaera TaxID=263510 RepID=A3IP56_9CHRO|nr:Histone-like DNA-binding protein [Crocosphaera chwakensis CCY0110]
MNKEELVNMISAKTRLTKKETSHILDALTDTIMETVADGDKVVLVGFGTFEPRDRKERKGMNPQTGQPITIPATTVPAFSAGKLFKEKVVESL